MPSIKQLQSRLSDKKNSLDKVNSDITRASNSKNNTIVRRLDQEKATLSRDIRKLERQLYVMENASSN